MEKLLKLIQLCLVTYCIVIFYTDCKTTYQCFETQGNPFVNLQCAPGSVIKVEYAFHGRHPDNDTSCYLQENDCTENQIDSHYDWIGCLGKQECIKWVQQNWMPSCRNYSQYLQVGYNCIEEDNIIDVCEKTSQVVQDVYLKSPAYPTTYPANLNCECYLHTLSEGGELVLTNMDLIMEMINLEKCADWLLLEVEKLHRRRPNVLCGESAWEGMLGNRIHLYFHSDENHNISQVFQYNSMRPLRGFFFHLQGKPESNITVTCNSVEKASKKITELKLPSTPKNTATIKQKLRPKTKKTSDTESVTSGETIALKEKRGRKAVFTIITAITFMGQFFR